MRAIAFRALSISAVVACSSALAAFLSAAGVLANPPDNVQLQGLADLAVSGAHAQVGQPCQQGGPLVVVTVTITNTGTVGSNALDGGVTVREPNGPLSGRALLPQIAQGGSATVSVGLTAPGNPSQFAGNHQLFIAVNEQRAIPESDYSNNTFGPINVFIPANLCRSNPPGNVPPSPTQAAHPFVAAKPDFAIRIARVSLEPVCRVGFPIATVTALITNSGGAYRAETMGGRRADLIAAQDSTDPNYVGAIGLPALDAGASVRVRFPIYYSGKSMSAVSGTRSLTVSVNKNRLVDESNFANNAYGPLSLAIPATFCHPHVVYVRSNAMLYPTIPNLKKYAMNHRLSTPPPLIVMGGPGSLDTAWLSLSEANPYTGPCPVTLHFFGHIDGATGSGLTYYFTRFAGGVATSTSPVTTTIPTGGMLPISSTLTVDTGSAGFQSYEVTITAPPGSDTTTHGKVYFTVTCGPAPGPSASPGSSTDYLDMPANLRRTVDPTECGKYSSMFGSLFCPGAIKDPAKIVLVWDWPAFIFCPEGKTCYKRVDGYYVFKTKGSPGLVKVATIPDPDQKARAVDLVPGDCYTVRAYYHSLESADSNEYCLPPTPGETVLTATAPLVRANSYDRFKSDHADHWYCSGWTGGGLGGAPSAVPLVNLPVEVGNGHYWDPGTDPFPCWDYSYSLGRAGLLFDLSAFKGKYVDKATLTYSAGGEPPTCASQLLTATEDWTGKTGSDYLPPGDIFEFLPTTMTGDRFAVDVTKAVRDWQMYGNNFGFVLRSDDESTANHTAHCWSMLNDFKLDVKYFAGS